MATQMQTVQGTQEYLWQPDNFASFQKILGRGAESYIQGALMVVSQSKGLQECTPLSVYHAALEAASLGLSFDKDLRQAYLTPRKISTKIKGRNGQKDQKDQWTSEMRAQFKPHYNGLYNLADWTGNYRVINVSPVYKGEEVYENPLTGLHMVQLANGLLTVPNPDVSGLRKVTNGERGEIVGWLGYYKTHKGLEKSVYMSVSECEAHARQYSDSYKSDSSEKSLWDPKSPHRPTMEMKTVFRKLARFMDLSGERGEKLRRALAADDASDTLDVVATDIDPLDDVTRILVESAPVEVKAEEPKRSTEQNMKELGFDEPAAKPLPRKDNTPMRATTSNSPLVFPQMLVDEGLAENVPNASKIINLLCIAGKPADMALPKVNLYRKWRNAGLESKAAAAKAIAGEHPEENAA